jgi:peroxiredoxin
MTPDPGDSENQSKRSLAGVESCRPYVVKSEMSVKDTLSARDTPVPLSGGRMRKLFASALALIVCTSVASAQDKNWKKDLEAKLAQHLPPSKTSTGILERGETVKEPGVVLVVNQNGILADDGWGLGVPLTRVRNGRITNAVSSSASERQRVLQPGDKLYVQGFSVGDDRIDLRLFTTDVIDYTAVALARENYRRRFIVALRFEFDKDVLPSATVEDVEKAITPVLATESAFAAANATRSAGPAPPTRAPVTAGPVDLRVGDPAPDFSFVDGKGVTYTLADYKGKAVVIVWFSPNISYQRYGSLIQRSQCEGLRDARQYLVSLNAVYFMVSLSSPAENSAFVNQSCQGADFPILSDVEGRAAAAYGVARNEFGIDPSVVYGRGAGQVPRGAFVFGSTTYIGPDGKILYMEDLNEIGGHLRGYGRDVAIRLQQLGVKTLTEVSAPPPTPKTIELGQTIEQVEAILGKPAAVAKLGAKTVYTYPNMKVIFMNGKVTDVQ